MDLNKIGKVIKRLLPHGCIICCMIMLVFFVIDRMNANQAFLENEFHKWLLFIMSLLTLAESFSYYFLNHKLAKAEYKRKAAKRKSATQSGKARAK